MRERFTPPPEPRKIQPNFHPSSSPFPTTRGTPQLSVQQSKKTGLKKWILAIVIGTILVFLGLLIENLLSNKNRTASFPSTLPGITQTEIFSEDDLETTSPTPTNTAVPLDTPVSTDSPTPTVEPTLGSDSIFIREKDEMTMVYVPKGNFIMGSKDGEDDEIPIHQVDLDPYWIDKYEVSNAQYAECVEAGACASPRSFSSNKHTSYYGNPAYDNYPVIYVDWYQAQDYCAWAGGRLPTEAEWEKAARGTAGRTYPWGNGNPNCNLANYRISDNNYCVEDTRSVESYEDGASPYGALNMAGNVWEWVGDRYGNYLVGAVRNPTGPTDGIWQIIRGGCWEHSGSTIRGANRGYEKPVNSYYNLGFRCVFPQK
jgi:serine/threonine-protein kinase